MSATESSPSSSINNLLFATISIIGFQVLVYLNDGSVYSGIFHTASFHGKNGLVLKEAKLIKKGKTDTNVAKESVVETLLIPSTYLLYVVAKGILFPRESLIDTKLQDIRRFPDSVKQQDHVGRIDGTTTTKEFKLNPEAKVFSPYAHARPTATPIPNMPQVEFRPYAPPHPYDTLRVRYGHNPQQFVGPMGHSIAYDGPFPPLAASQILMQRPDQVVYLPINESHYNQGHQVAYGAQQAHDFVQGVDPAHPTQTYVLPPLISDQAMQIYLPQPLISNDPLAMQMPAHILPPHILPPDFPLNLPQQIPSPRK